MKLITALIFTAALANSSTAEDRLVIGAEGNKSVAIVDPSDGNRVLWQYKLSGPTHSLELLPNLNLLTQDGWQTYIELDLNKKVVWSYDGTVTNRIDSKLRPELHAIQRLADGNTMIAESGTSRIIEVGSDGKLVKQIPLQVSQSSVHSDTRQVRKLDNGNYLVAHEADQTVKEYDADGKAVWEFPIPLFGKPLAKGHGPEAFGGRCFAAIKAHNGNYLIATGNGHSVLEVTPEKKIVWRLTQHDLDGVVLAWVTTIQELKNGNLIIGNCHAGPQNPQIIEVTRDKKVVWSFKDFNTFGNSLAVSLVVDGEIAQKIRSRLSSGQ